MLRSFRVFSAAVLVTVSVSLFSQPAKSTWLTTSAGVTSSWIINQNVYGNPELEYGTKFGITLNLGASYFINTQYGISTGVGFGNLGQNYHGMQKDADAVRRVNLNYIQVPVFLMRQLGDARNPCWLTLGPQLMFLSSASQYYTREEGEALPHPQYLPEGRKDVTEWYRPADLTLNLGITNIYFLRTNDKVRSLVSFNGALGLTDINAADYQVPNIRDVYKSSHNFYLGVQVGLMFNP